MSLPRAFSALLTAALLTGAAAAMTVTPASADTAATGSGFVVSKAQYNSMFPDHNAFYTYDSLVTAMKAYPEFAHTGTAAVRRREAAAFLANVGHETSGLRYIVEQNKANWPTYCDTSQPYGCPAGQSAYHGRGPLQLSWNFNYHAAGQALHVDLLRHPELVQQKPVVSWKTALWFWMSQRGAGSMTAHSAIVNGKGFGETIRTINGAVECNTTDPLAVQERQDRVTRFKKFAQRLNVSPGKNLSC